MNMPSVNVLIFTYNQESFVEETIESVIKQSYGNITKIVIADDGSTDKTPDIITEYAINNPSIYPVLAKKNKGIAYNMNRAIKHIKGDYVSFLDGDDLMDNQKIEKQVNYLNSNSELVACAHDMKVFDSVKNEFKGNFSKIINFKKIKGQIGVKSIFDPSLLICPSSVMYKRETLPEGLDTRLKYWYEFFFIVEVLMKGNMGYMEDVLGIYRLHSTNVTGSKNFIEFGLENSLIVYSIILARYPELYPLIKKRKSITYLAKILECIRYGNNTKAKKLSKVLMSEGNFFKGFITYLTSFILNEKRANKLFQNKRFIKVFLEFF
jgi:glycosyltransferase involved in cell wall biosynthesis